MRVLKQIASKFKNNNLYELVYVLVFIDIKNNLINYNADDFF